MTSSLMTFADRLAILQRPEVRATLPQIKHGVERETLRINPDGGLATTEHNAALGSALTHEFITTDFSESLLEFITPPESDPNVTIDQLKDVHKFVIENIGEERLWPMSMPCFINGEDNIPIANYGTSNIAKMKSLYRLGLKNRYGSMMQAIAGVHFNFSLSSEFWQQWLENIDGQKSDKHSVSDAYFGMIRNYRRFCWLIPYLFGASPAICGSFIAGKKTTLPFKKLGKGTIYLPFATSLRMSDLGYTNSEQAGLNICYNQMDSYISSVRKAINTPSEKYAEFGVKEGEEFRQLNSNVLQIENELYSPIRPKQPTLPLEKPTDALAKRGVNYIEVRALDVNPFNEVGISKEQFYFLDVFLTYCLVAPSEYMSQQQYAETESNLKAVVVNGRDPQLTLSDETQLKSIPEWTDSLFSDMTKIAEVLDQANNCHFYSEALALQKQKVADPSLTPSAKLLDILLSENKDNGRFGVELAEKYRNDLIAAEYKYYSKETFEQQATDSLAIQKQKEQEDSLSFEAFLEDYFAAPQSNYLAKDDVS